jgi:hypothetical protein
LGEFHDQGDAKLIVIREPSRGLNDTHFGRPAQARPISRPGVRRPQGVFGVFSYYLLVIQYHFLGHFTSSPCDPYHAEQKKSITIRKIVAAKFSMNEILKIGEIWKELNKTKPCDQPVLFRPFTSYSSLKIGSQNIKRPNCCGFYIPFSNCYSF